MSEIKNIFDISGRAMAAQLVRLNTVASNLANAGTIASTKEEAFRALKPVFQTTYADQMKHSGVSTVDVVTVAEAYAGAGKGIYAASSKCRCGWFCLSRSGR